MMKKSNVELMPTNKALIFFGRVVNKIEERILRIKDKYPVFKRHPFLFYLTIPLAIAGFIKVRYLAEFIFAALTTWIIMVLSEKFGIQVSYQTIATPIIVIFIMIRFGVRINRVVTKKAVNKKIKNKTDI